MSRLRALLFALVLAGVGAAVGCGGTSTGNLPVDSPLIEFQAPEADELLPDSASDEGDDWGDDDDDDDGATPSAAPAAGGATPPAPN